MGKELVILLYLNKHLETVASVRDEQSETAVFKEGNIYPETVTRIAMESAASVVSGLPKTRCAIADSNNNIF